MPHHRAGRRNARLYQAGHYYIDSVSADGAAHPCKKNTPGSIGDDPEEFLAAQVIDPRQWGVGPGDNVFALFVVKISKSHVILLVIMCFYCTVIT